MKNESDNETQLYSAIYSGGAIAKDDEFTYTFSQNAVFTVAGSYTVSAWANVNMPGNHINLHNDTAETAVLIVEPVVVGGEMLKPGFMAVIYPNPSDGVFTVTTSSRSTVEIIDVRGVVISRVTIDGSKTLSLKSKGLYLLNFIDGFGNRAAKRILVK